MVDGKWSELENSMSDSHSARGRLLLIPVITGISHVVNFSLFQYSLWSSLITGCPLQFSCDALCDDLLFHLFSFIRIIRVLTFTLCFTRQLACYFLSVTASSWKLLTCPNHDPLQSKKKQIRTHYKNKLKGTQKETEKIQLHYQENYA